MDDHDVNDLWAIIANADRLAFALKGGIIAMQGYTSEVQAALEAYLKCREGGE